LTTQQYTVAFLLSSLTDVWKADELLVFGFLVMILCIKFKDWLLDKTIFLTTDVMMHMTFHIQRRYCQ
jgi:ascorbate-specific PTS system EIIC-type component UlaA